MRIDAAFPSNYLKASDLQGEMVTVTMSHIKMEPVGEDNKPVLYFAGKKKGLVLNKTNSYVIAETYGPETDAWVGQRIQLFDALVDFQGRQVAAIRVRIPKAAARPAAAIAAPIDADVPMNGVDHEHSGIPQRTPRAPAVRLPSASIDDEIPF